MSFPKLPPRLAGHCDVDVESLRDMTSRVPGRALRSERSDRLSSSTFVILLIVQSVALAACQCGATCEDASCSTGGGSTGGGSTGGGSTGGGSACGFLAQPPVPATGDGLFASGTSGYLIASDTVHWTIATGGAGSTSLLPLPSGVSSIQLRQSELAPNGHVLLFFLDGSTPKAAFFTSGAFGTATTLPSDSQSVHADSGGHLYAVDSANILWDGSSGTFINRGALPLPSSTVFLPAPFAWTVAANGAVHLLAINPNAHTELDAMHLPAGALGWSTPVNITAGYQSNLTDVALIAAADGSLHAAYPLARSYGSSLFYQRSVDGSTWTQGELLHDVDVDTQYDINLTPRLLVLGAVDYDSAEAVYYEEGGGGLVGAHAGIAYRCGTTMVRGWAVLDLPLAPYSSASPLAAFDETGSAFLLLETTAGQDLIRYAH